MTTRRDLLKLLTLSLATPQSGWGSSRVVELLQGDASGFAAVTRENPIQLPRDHAAHPDFRTEWWYLTANLTDTAGQRWGLQWTLFRHAMSAEPERFGWASPQIWMAHAAITSPTGHRYEERFARGGIGQAGVVATEDSFSAWIDDWRWDSVGPMFQAELTFSVGDRRIRVTLQATGPFVRQGDQGFSQKSSSGQASHYYSQPHIQASATVQDDDGITMLQGQAWLDREWSSELLGEQQRGWDWFSVHLEDGRKLMAFQLRERSGETWRSGSIVETDGSIRLLGNADIHIRQQQSHRIQTPQGMLRLPLEWELAVPGLDAKWQIRPLYPQQWMGTAYPYWEGVIVVNGSTVGEGYMELTGYDR